MSFAVRIWHSNSRLKRAAPLSRSR